MSLDFLDFEQPIAELQEKIKELKSVSNRNSEELGLSEQIVLLEQQSEQLTQKIFANLSAWQVAQLARHPHRPYTKDYIDRIFTDFDELHGDRAFADDSSMLGGTALLNHKPVMVIGHQKGRTTNEKVYRNFGMPSPEGYRKAQRLARLAEKFNMPIITFIDTPGAYPGVGAEERGQSEAIASSLKLFSGIRVPVICNVIGEGGSGGALAIGVGDQINMCQYSTYSVISPEGCASILWKSSEKAAQAAESMGITANRLHELELVDRVLTEPLGGAHRCYTQVAETLKQAIVADLENLETMSVDALIERRYKRLNRFSFQG
jgi:acetyl-CoA carboxylase carboxyl transferase subunit alpha